MADELKPIKKESPPPVVRRPSKRSSKYDPIVKQLQEDPGTEYKVLEDVTTSTAKVLIDKGLKVTTRTTGKKNRVDVWAHWPEDQPIPSSEDESEPEAPAKKTPAKKAAAAKPATSTPKKRPSRAKKAPAKA